MSGALAGSKLSRRRDGDTTFSRRRRRAAAARLAAAAAAASASAIGGVPSILAPHHAECIFLPHVSHTNAPPPAHFGAPSQPRAAQPGATSSTAANAGGAAGAATRLRLTSTAAAPAAGWGFEAARLPLATHSGHSQSPSGTLASGGCRQPWWCAASHATPSQITISLPGRSSPEPHVRQKTSATPDVGSSPRYRRHSSIERSFLPSGAM